MLNKIRIMIARIVVFLVLLICVFGQRKPGVCPPLLDVGICEMSCYSDMDCIGSYKCCRTACGGTFCTTAATSAKTQIGEKAGYCPAIPTGPWVCSSRCGSDSDCRGSKKCCRNRCGAMACTKPEFMDF